MKIIITENQYILIKEEVSNRRQEKLINLIKTLGIDKASKAVGNMDNLFKVLDINSPMDFLNLFNDLDVVQSVEDEDWTLYRYKKGHNLMIYDRKNDHIYISYYEIWSVLGDKFGLNYDEIKELTQRWLDEVYNLRGITTLDGKYYVEFELDEVYNLRGITTSLMDDLDF